MNRPQYDYLARARACVCVCVCTRRAVRACVCVCVWDAGGGGDKNLAVEILSDTILPSDSHDSNLIRPLQVRPTFLLALMAVIVHPPAFLGGGGGGWWW